MTDLGILRELEKELGKKLERVNLWEIGGLARGKETKYAIDAGNNIIGIKITYVKLKSIPNAVKLLTKLTILHFYGNKISDISPLQQLTLLTTLDLGDNQISDISPLQQLSQLTTLNLSRNQISNISPLQQLTLLTQLNLTRNQISDTAPLKQSTQLTQLYLGDNQISDIAHLQQLIQLTQLYLDGNQISDISPLQQLTQLTRLFLGSNRISDISPLQQITKLAILDLHKNQISDISPLQLLTQLTTLYLDTNQVSDISSLQLLTLLTTLYLDTNQISDISPLQQLSSLKSVRLTHNPIKQLPAWITDFNMEIEWRDGLGNNIIFFDNPIETPPIEIIKQGKQAIKDWFAANKKRLNEIKVLFVGEAKAGKTSVIKKLKDGTYNPAQNQTDGIVIEKLPFEELKTFKAQQGLHGITGYFWDFGGQEIMSSTHQFFMTKRSLYVLVLEARRDAGTDKQVRDWMERIQAFGGDSPVIIIGNKIDLNPSFGIDTTTLQRDFPQIKRYINVSCQTGENIEELKEVLNEYVPKAELFNTEIDERWIDVKNELQEIIGKEFTLPYKRFTAICDKHFIETQRQQKNAIHFLHDLGIVLHFDALRMAEYFVLDPLWVTTGVYRILTSDTAARQKGEVDVADLNRIINDETDANKDDKHRQAQALKYTPSECMFMADIMAQFKLGYYINNNTKLLIPDLFDKETPKIDSEKFYNANEKLSLIYAYKYLPPAIMPRIMVELKDDVEKYWRSGAILACKKNIKAEAMIAAQDNKLTIIVLGEHEQKREYLSVIRHVIDKINATYTLEVGMLIPLPGHPEMNIEYDELIGYEREGIAEYFVGKLRKRFNVGELLDGIKYEKEVSKEAEATLKVVEPGKQNAKIFLASSNELLQERTAFEIFINRKNKELVKKNIFLHLDVWEDLPAAVSQTRSQDEYNKEILGSDITVVLFFTKVGKYTEEEFEVALEQFKATGKPLIFTYFKDSGITTGGANRKDLVSLWDFQDKLKALGHFYTVYTNTDELIRKFNDQLTKYFEGLGTGM